MATAPKRTRAPAPANETKADKFKRLGGKRVGRAIKAIKGIGNLAGSGYEYTDAQVSAIRGHLDAATRETLDRFANRGKVSASEIKL